MLTNLQAQITRNFYPLAILTDFHGQIKVTSAIKKWQSWAKNSRVARPVLPSAHWKNDTARFETRSTTPTNSGMKPAHHGGLGVGGGVVRSELTGRTEQDNGSRGVACKDCCKIPKFDILANFWNL